MAAFAVAQLTFVPASAQDARHRGGDSLVYVDRDTTKYVRDGNNQNFSRYDKRIHYYRKGWASLIPTQHVLQFCGNMGLVSVGIGWDYGKRRQWETHLLVGFVPKYESDYAKMTFTFIIAKTKCAFFQNEMCIFCVFFAVSQLVLNGLLNGF